MEEEDDDFYGGGGSHAQDEEFTVKTEGDGRDTEMEAGEDFEAEDDGDDSDDVRMVVVHG